MRVSCAGQLTNKSVVYVLLSYSLVVCFSSVLLVCLFVFFLGVVFCFQTFGDFVVVLGFWSFFFFFSFFFEKELKVGRVE